MIYLCIIELTNNCNLRCKHCYSHFTHSTYLSQEDYTSILDELKKYECDTIRLSGGEPTLLGESLFVYARIAKKKAYNVQITTNGVMTDFFSDERWKLFSNVQISLDGTQEVHERIRGEGTYKKAFASLLSLREMGVPVNVMMTVGRYNLSEIVSLKKILDHHDIPLFIERITGTGRADSNNELNKDELKNLMDIVYQHDIKTSEPLSIFYDKEKMRYLYDNCVMGGCTAGVGALCISAEKEVFPCPRLRVSCGNLSASSLETILTSKIMEDLCDRDLLKGNCGLCEDKWICGGCRASAYVCTNDMLEGDEGCFWHV